MRASFKEILNSTFAKFIVGEEEDGYSTEFFVHEKAISRLLQPQRALTNGTSTEARAVATTWKDVSKDTFERFVQFAYTGDYSIPETKKRVTVLEAKKDANALSVHPASPTIRNGIRIRDVFHESDNNTTIELERSVGGIDTEVKHQPTSEKYNDETQGVLTNSNSVTRKHRKKKSKVVTKASPPEPAPLPDPEPELELELEPDPEFELAELQQAKLQSSAAGPENNEADLTPIVATSEHAEEVSYTLTPDFSSISYPLVAPRDNYVDSCEPLAEFEKQHSYSDVLLSHASLYVLGDSRLIDSLKALALFKLHKTLCIFQLDKENIEDITDLARYSYSEKNQGVGEGIGELRGLVCQYMAIHAMELSSDPKFMNLLAEGGQIVIDFLKYEMQRKH